MNAAPTTPRPAIARRRRSLGLTQTEAAARAGMPQPRWSDLESGRWPNPTIATFRRAARALQCTIDDLVPDESPYDDDTPRSRP
tara:strand:- start:206 stop:457 length:252 start_codon:yes stop_codon:yes gene_type:complete